MGVPPIFHPIFFYQNDSEWLEMDFKQNFKNATFWNFFNFFKASLMWVKHVSVSFVFNILVLSLNVGQASRP